MGEVLVEHDVKHLNSIVLDDPGSIWEWVVLVQHMIYLTCNGMIQGPHGMGAT